jgi:hypothetical protein
MEKRGALYNNSLLLYVTYTITIIHALMTPSPFPGPQCCHIGNQTFNTQTTWETHPNYNMQKLKRSEKEMLWEKQRKKCTVINMKNAFNWLVKRLNMVK